MIERSRKEVMRHMMQENLALCVGRAGQVVGLEKPWNIVFCSDSIEDFNLFYRGGNVNFPLYIYTNNDKKDIFSHVTKQKEKQPNINPELVKRLSQIYNKPVGQTFLSDTTIKDQVGQTFLSDNHNQTDKNANNGTDKNVCSTNTNADGNEDGITIRRRKLPHWVLKGATYFITFRAIQRELSVDEQKIVLEHIKEGDDKFYELIAAVIMSDHVHVLLTPRENITLSRIMKGIKGVSAHKINMLRKTKGNVWQDESYDRIIRDQGELTEKLNYMLNNPVKKGLTDDIWNYHGWYFNDRYETGKTDKNANNATDKSVNDQTDKNVNDQTDKNVCSTSNRVNTLLTPEDIFYYIYAVLYSNIYRAKYAEFLKMDFPRIPFTKDYKLFENMAEYGKNLVDLHLLKSTELDPPIAKLQGKGNKLIDKIKYDSEEKKVFVNKTQYFEGVDRDIWEYQIGGYQVCNKWLKDRKGRKLSLDEIKHYCKVVTAIKKTIVIQKRIDDIYPGIEKEVIYFKK